MATQWGRKETVIWPPHTPIYTYGALAIAFFCTLACIGARFVFSVPLLQQFYTPAYVRSAAGAMFNKHGSYQMIYVAGLEKVDRIARPDDVVSGSTAVLVGKPLPVTLSDEAAKHGARFLYRGPKQVYADKALHAYLRSQIWCGEDFGEPYGWSLLCGLVVLLAQLPFSVRRDIARRKTLKYGRLLKGPVMVSPAQFNKTLGGDGLGIETDGKTTRVCIPRRSEAKHIQIMGDTGVGKSTLMMQMLKQIEDRKESAIVYDPAGEFIQRFYREKRGDWVLNPLDARMPYWTPSSELRTPAEARTIAASLYQPTSDKKGEFFTETPQKVFARLLKYRPTPQDLVAWMSNEAEIDARVAGTELAAMVAKDAPDQRNGVLASLGLIADSLRLLPTLEQAKKREWSATEWAEKREGWIFLTSTEAEQDALRPLHSLWIDLLILRLLTQPKEGQTRAWFLLDELASLQRLPQFHTALTKGRKSDNPIIFGYQGKAQLEVIYGHLAEVMLSQPATKFVLKTAEPKAAKWASELLGDIEIERLRETVADGKRQGKSFTLDRQTEPLVMASEIGGLSDLHAFVKQGNYVSRFSFPHMDMQLIAEALVPREPSEEDLWLALETPNAQTTPAATPQQGAAAAPPSGPALPPEKPRQSSLENAPAAAKPADGATAAARTASTPEPNPGRTPTPATVPTTVKDEPSGTHVAVPAVPPEAARSPKLVPQTNPISGF